MKRRTAWAMVGAVMLSMGTAGGADSQAGPDGDTINCAYPVWPGFAPVHLAQELGYFAEEGLIVNQTFDDDRGNVLAALERGEVQCDMRTVGEYQARPRTEGTQGTIIGTIDVSLGGDGVLVDGTIKSMADLRGKVFAAEPYTPAGLIAQLELKKHGLSLADVRVREIKSADASAVFVEPEVAGVAIYEPWLSQALKSSGKPGAYIMKSSRDYPGLITDVIIARTDDLNTNPKPYRKFLRGIYRAIDYFQANRAEAVNLMAPHFELTPPEFDEVLANLEYTPYAQAVDFMGTHGQPGKLHAIFDTVMELNLENNAADTRLEASRQIDNSVITDLFPEETREE